MLDGVHLSGVHDRFSVGSGHPQIEGRDHGISVAVLAGDIDTRLQVKVIDRKTCDFFHKALHWLIIETDVIMTPGEKLRKGTVAFLGRV
jgi:hypothetical protein